MNGVDLVMELMAVSATTAPKTKGENYVQVKIVKRDELKTLAQGMVRFGEKVGKKDFDRDGKNVEHSQGVVLIGIHNAPVPGLNCGACGCSSCQELSEQKRVQVEFTGPTCAYRILDMGIALGSAVKTASMHNIDNRIMYRIGAAAKDMGLVDWDFVMGIPLSVTGKNIYFDR